MSFVGNKTNLVEQTLQPDVFFPAIELTNFQAAYRFYEDIAADTLIASVTQAIIDINLQLAPLKVATSFNDYGQAKFNNDSYAHHLYLSAVHALAAAYLLQFNISLDATKEASARNANLQDRQDHQL